MCVWSGWHHQLQPVAQSARTRAEHEDTRTRGPQPRGSGAAQCIPPFEQRTISTQLDKSCRDLTSHLRSRKFRARVGRVRRQHVCHPCCHAAEGAYPQTLRQKDRPRRKPASDGLLLNCQTVFELWRAAVAGLRRAFQREARQAAHRRGARLAGKRNPEQGFVPGCAISQVPRTEGPSIAHASGHRGAARSAWPFFVFANPVACRGSIP